MDSPPLDPINLPSFYSPPLEPMKFTLEEQFYFENMKASSSNVRPLYVGEASSSAAAGTSWTNVRPLFVGEASSSAGAGTSWTPPDSPVSYAKKYYPGFFIFSPN